MKLEHLIQAYNYNRLPVKLEDIKEYGEESGTIKFNEDINAAYLLDNEKAVIAMNIFINCIILKDKTINNMLIHTTQIINIIQKTIELLANTKQEEANKIMKQLGLFNGNIKKKSVKFINYVFKIDIVDGILMFSIIENENIIV